MAPRMLLRTLQNRVQRPFYLVGALLLLPDTRDMFKAAPHEPQPEYAVPMLNPMVLSGLPDLEEGKPAKQMFAAKVHCE